MSSTQVLSTAQAAAVFAAGQPVGQLVSAGVLTLSQQILKGMIMTKLKLVSAALFCCVLSGSAIGFAFAQPGANKKDDRTAVAVTLAQALTTAKDTDEAFIRRVSQDLRGVEPTPAEIHFFVTSKEAKKREKIVDLFIAEREAKKKASNRPDGDWSFDGTTNTMRLWDLVARADFAKDPAKKPALQPAPDLALLKTNVELAKLVVREKEILLVAAIEEARNLKGDERARRDSKIKLLEIDVQRAQLLLEQAEVALKAAEKKSASSKPKLP